MTVPGGVPYAMRQMGAPEPLTAEDPADLARLSDHDEPDIDTVSTSIVERAILDVRTRPGSRAVDVLFISPPAG